MSSVHENTSVHESVNKTKIPPQKARTLIATGSIYSLDLPDSAEGTNRF